MTVRSLAIKPGMTRAGGPSSGPRGPRWPKPCQAREKSHAASLARRQPGGMRSSGSLEIFVSAHQVTDRLRKADAAVFGLVVLQQGDEDAGAGQRGVVERVGEADFAVGVAVAEVGAAG